MRVVLQRVSEANVKVEGDIIGAINSGICILLGIELDDTGDDVDWLVKKITQLRIFNDEFGKMNLSIRDVHGDFLVISQFTLHAVTKKGNRPSYVQAARPEVAIPLYELFIHRLAEYSELKVEKGEFGADMKISLINDGPVTIFIDTKNKV